MRMGFVPVTVRTDPEPVTYTSASALSPRVQSRSPATTVAPDCTLKNAPAPAEIGAQEYRFGETDRGPVVKRQFGPTSGRLQNPVVRGESRAWAVEAGPPAVQHPKFKDRVSAPLVTVIVPWSALTLAAEIEPPEWLSTPLNRTDKVSVSAKSPLDQSNDANPKVE